MYSVLPERYWHFVDLLLLLIRFFPDFEKTEVFFLRILNAESKKIVTLQHISLIIMYQPPFTVSADAINLVAEISAQIERYAIRLEQEDGLSLRKTNRIKTIHSPLPIENMVHANQQEYYNAIALSSREGQSGPFVDFILKEILKTIKQHQGAELVDVGENNVKNVGVNERKLLTVIANTPNATAHDMADALGITQRQCERILAKLKQQGVIIRIGAAKNGHWEVVEYLNKTR